VAWAKVEDVDVVPVEGRVDAGGLVVESWCPLVSA
jgi:hypothetical protein